MAGELDGGLSPEAAAEKLIENKQTIGAESAALRQFNTGIEGRSVRSLNVVMHHLDTLEAAGNALNNNDFRLFNTFANQVAKQTGAVAPVSFDATKEIVSSEIIKAIIGAGGALEDRKDAKETINAANSPAQLAGVIRQYKELFAGQLMGLESAFVSSTGRTQAEFRKKLNPKIIKLLPSIPASQDADGGWSIKKKEL